MLFGLNQTGVDGELGAEALETIADAGFDGVEPNVRLDGPLQTEAGRDRLAALADDRALSIPSVSTTVHWEFPLSSGDEDVRRRGVELGLTMIDVAARLQADTILVVPGVLQAEPGYEEAYERALASVRELAAAGASAGVTVAIENVGNDLLLSPLEFREFVDRASEHGPVGAYVDVGNAYYYNQRPDHWLRILDDRVVKVHAKGWLDDAGTTVPLAGDVDWPAVATALDEIGYEGWVTAEVPPYEHAPGLTPRHVLESMRTVL